jgi:hypothetical protein
MPTPALFQVLLTICLLSVLTYGTTGLLILAGRGAAARDPWAARLATAGAAALGMAAGGVLSVLL